VQPPDKIRITFGRLLREMRDAKGLSRAGLVERARDGNRLAGLVSEALAHWEEGRRMPLPVQLRAVLSALGPEPSTALGLLEIAASVDVRYRAGDWWRRQDWTPEERLADWSLATAGQSTRPARSILGKRVEEAAQTEDSDDENGS
jgi:transcriptional regulator with XRE-family HTH domain